MARKIPQDVRNLIIRKYIEGKSQAYISSFLEVASSTVSNIVKRYNATGSSEIASVDGDKRSFLSMETKEEVCRWVDMNAILTLNKI